MALCIYSLGTSSTVTQGTVSGQGSSSDVWKKARSSISAGEPKPIVPIKNPLSHMNAIKKNNAPTTGMK